MLCHNRVIIYTKIKESAWGCSVCVSGYTFMLGGVGLKLGMGVGDGPQGSRAYFWSNPTERPANLVGRTPDGSVMHSWSQSLCRGQLGSTRGHSAQENSLWQPTLVERTLDQMQCIDGIRSQPGSSRGQIAQECSMATRFGRKKPCCPMAARFGRKNP